MAGERISVFTTPFAQKVERLVAQQLGSPPGGTSRPPRTDRRFDDDGIEFFNDSGFTIPPFGIVGVDSSMDFGSGDAIPKVKRPGTTYYEDWLVNGDAPVSDQAYGMAQLGPVVVFAYDSGSPTAKSIYGPKPSQFTGSAGYAGLLRTIKIIDSTNKWAKGFLYSPITALLAKADSGVTARSGTTPGSGTVSIWCNVSGTLTDTTMDVTAYNMSGGAVASAAYIQIKLIGGQWWVDVEDCG